MTVLMGFLFLELVTVTSMKFFNVYTKINRG